MSTTLYWHDYETFGQNPRWTGIAQFAGIRTDEDLKEIGEPLMVYSQPPQDSWPDPIACLITGITPHITAKQIKCTAETDARACTRFEKHIA